jgi:hypothetical protein
MVQVWAAALAAVLFLSGCSVVNDKPIRMEMPSAKRHFIVMGSPALP